MRKKSALFFPGKSQNQIMSTPADHDRRTFLKTLGIAGAGMAMSCY
jgi:hypothetical protein